MPSVSINYQVKRKAVIPPEPTSITPGENVTVPAPIIDGGTKLNATQNYLEVIQPFRNDDIAPQKLVLDGATVNGAAQFGVEFSINGQSYVRSIVLGAGSSCTATGRINFTNDNEYNPNDLEEGDSVPTDPASVVLTYHWEAA